MIVSNGAASGRPNWPSPCFRRTRNSCTCRRLSFAFAISGFQPLDRMGFIVSQLCQHGGLVAAAGTDLQRLAEPAAAGLQHLDHARHDIGLRDRLAEAEGSAVSS